MNDSIHPSVGSIISLLVLFLIFHIYACYSSIFFFIYLYREPECFVNEKKKKICQDTLFCFLYHYDYVQRPHCPSLTIVYSV